MIMLSCSLMTRARPSWNDAPFLKFPKDNSVEVLTLAMLRSCNAREAHQLDNKSELCQIHLPKHRLLKKKHYGKSLERPHSAPLLNGTIFTFSAVSQSSFRPNFFLRIIRRLPFFLHWPPLRQGLWCDHSGHCFSEDWETLSAVNTRSW